MAATTKDRQTLALKIEREIACKPKDGVTIPAGVIVAVAGATGLADNAADTAAMKVVGRSAHRCDTSSTADPKDEFCIVETGVFAYLPSANLLALGDAALFTTVYVVDNQTVGLAADLTNDIPAGRLEEIKDGLYYVAIGLGV